jgi:threonine synthase
MPSHYTGLIEKYRERLPVSRVTPVISLNEGATPLIELVNVPRVLQKNVRLFAKFEGLNPTGSFKDRGMTMAVSKAMEAGARAIICASTGNTSAAAAAYAARAGMACFVLIPEGKIALGKLSQAMMHGSVVIQIRGNFDDGMRLVQELAHRMPLNIVNSINPYRLQGQKTIAFEVIEALGDAPDYHALPVGNAGNITAHWMGYSEAVCQNTAVLRGQLSVPPRQIRHAPPGDVGLPGRRRSTHRQRPAGGEPGHRCDRNPHRQSGVVAAGTRGTKGVRRVVQRVHR